MLLKICKMLVGLLLLLPCWIITLTTWDLLQAAQPDTDILIAYPALAFIAGFAIWLVAFALFPHPVRSYILAHELTHALWGVIMGARIAKISVKADQGNVMLSKTNFLITLAPYFFPLYTVLLIAVYFILYLFIPVEQYAMLWLFLVGMTWSFHVTFTVSALMQHQTDIQQQGHLFSYTVIYLANLVGISLWIIMVTPATFQDGFHALWQNITSSANGLITHTRELINH